MVESGTFPRSLIDPMACSPPFLLPLSGFCLLHFILCLLKMI